MPDYSYITDVDPKAGGAVTQLTNKATGVTINKATGQITTAAAALAAGAEVTFRVTNSAVKATDVPVVAIRIRRHGRQLRGLRVQRRRRVLRHHAHQPFRWQPLPGCRHQLRSYEGFQRMKVKMSALLAAMPAMAEFGKKDMPARAAYRVSKLVRKMNAAGKDFDKARMDAVKRHGEMKKLDSGEDGWKVKPENREAFEKEMEALTAEEVDLEGCAVVPWADVEKLSLPPVILADLAEFIEEPKE